MKGELESTKLDYVWGKVLKKKKVRIGIVKQVFALDSLSLENEDLHNHVNARLVKYET